MVATSNYFRVWGRAQLGWVLISFSERRFYLSSLCKEPYPMIVIHILVC